MKNQNTGRLGFTLIELLVVVLIIGILASVALPQYNQAVLKSRTVQLRILADALRDAQLVYQLENGTYATKFEELNIQIPDGATITPYGSNAEQAKWPNQIIAYTSINNQIATYVFDNKHNIGIHSYFGGRHICQSYTELADKVCLSLGGKYYGTACATAENLAAGKHGCQLYDF